MSRSHLVAALGIQENPAKFYHLCGIFGDINAMLIAGGSDVDDHVAVQIRLWVLRRRRHVWRCGRPGGLRFDALLFSTVLVGGRGAGGSFSRTFRKVTS